MDEKATLTLKRVSRAIAAADKLTSKKLVLVSRDNAFYVAEIESSGCSGVNLGDPYYLGTKGLTGPTYAMGKVAAFAGIPYQKHKAELLEPFQGAKTKKPKKAGVVVNQTEEVPAGMTMAQFFNQKLK